MKGKRGLVPYALLGVLTLGAGLGVGLGLSEGPLTNSGKSGPPSKAQMALFAAVARTTNATSLTMQPMVPGSPGLIGPTVYQAPDRSRVLFMAGGGLGDAVGPVTITIGRTLYWYDADGTYHTTIHTEHLHGKFAANSARNDAMAYLDDVYRFNRVTRTGDTFVATTTMRGVGLSFFGLLYSGKAEQGPSGLAYAPYPSRAKSSAAPTYDVTLRVTVHDHFVVSEDLTARGPFDFPHKKNSVRHASVTYSGINSSTPVVVPR